VASGRRDGVMTVRLVALAVLLCDACRSLTPAAVPAAAGRAADAAMRRRGGAPTPLALAGVGLLFAGTWGLSEIARGYLFTGFPWLAIGYAHVDGPLAALSPLVGVYGVCTLAALSAFGVGAAAAWPP